MPELMPYLNKLPIPYLLHAVAFLGVIIGIFEKLRKEGKLTYLNWIAITLALAAFVLNVAKTIDELSKKDEIGELLTKLDAQLTTALNDTSGKTPEEKKLLLSEVSQRVQEIIRLLHGSVPSSERPVDRDEIEKRLLKLTKQLTLIDQHIQKAKDENEQAMKGHLNQLKTDLSGSISDAENRIKATMATKTTTLETQLTRTGNSLTAAIEDNTKALANHLIKAENDIKLANATEAKRLIKAIKEIEE